MLKITNTKIISKALILSLIISLMLTNADFVRADSEDFKPEHPYIDASTGITYYYVIGTDNDGDYAEIVKTSAALFPKTLNIPDTLEGLPVRSIAKGAFENSMHNGDDLEEIVLPELKFLANQAFSSFENLKTVDMGMSDVIFAGDVFYECPSIFTVVRH